VLEFKLPEVGENIESGTVVAVMVSVGDSVSEGQDLIEIETEKASLPVPSPCDGVIAEILIKENEEVNIGQVLMKIEESESASTAKEKNDEKIVEAPQQEAPQPAPAGAATQTAPSPVALTSAPAAQTNVPAAPSVRRFAREIGITVSQVPGSGPGGRISEENVKTFAKQLNLGRMALPSTGPEIKPLPDFSKWGEVKREPMSKIRKVTADHLSYCWSTIPHVTQFGKADSTEIDKLRKKYSDKKQKLTITPFLLKIMASAMKEFPQFNTAVDMLSHEVVYKKYIHLGIAVDTQNGLLVPVIRDVDKKGVIEINNEVVEMAKKARDRKVTLDDLKGGCMTLTNLGGIFGTSFTPIINWPEVAILGVSRGVKEAVYMDDKFVPRMLLPLSLSYDHRIVDGAAAARYLKWVCAAIENPADLKLE